MTDISNKTSGRGCYLCEASPISALKGGSDELPELFQAA